MKKQQGRYRFTLPANAKGLEQVRVSSPRTAELPFFRWAYGECWQSRLRNPKKPEDGVGRFQNHRLRFAVQKGIWTTYGQIYFYLYCAAKRQVRARLSFTADPSPSITSFNHGEISWLLDESDRVLPALIQSVEAMHCGPLGETGLFQKPDLSGYVFGESGIYEWTTAGWDAK